ncbi:MAG TPA: DeoR/GlpR transcriptional regulator [Hungateiclostridium thermocellum]|jgi:DeoR/GlpR family transcriptional regulator of sugar metabolism|uniref:Transcriptional regulator, DeoR family n=2 Tax=Acetivibrio thermocellus TaxID=1515 RepID=A3DI64_ACET2|nr:DeoR/GlpR family DNA-binding transcription regulator [Acetivibrio thermocellus]CDG36964.1 DeoR family transcriptional regulator [Acetivibrio thermocellus BC1]ABN53643.1 transcriptional regulator, DeoR family [Acetivibrio thermocellus ATCC 27405]ADU73170.1 transcriptional regulator, DeoR family [Acetivibrio thermocellus DSM 1313]ALX07084.1 transcriptional regulator, DeoR family [Acetivibrio thermocellus AD2]ANV74820.1 transcriptional regulator, DeoR family [Acetivibrio thermocellus DSM 2360]
MKKDRYSQIIEIMERQNTISIRELAEKLNCTEMTIRRNLDKLQEMNFVKRERGYAVLLKPAQPTDYYVQIGEHKEEKEAIAIAALKYIRPYQTICIDSGTTTQLLVETLPENIHLSVITTSLTASMTLSNNENIQVLIPTGFLHHKNRSVILADPDIMKQYQADVAFLSCRAFRVPGGAFEHSQSLTSTKKALASIAQKRILLLDYSKWGINSLCNSFPLEQIDIIITDNKAPKDSVSKIVKLGKEIIIVNPETKSIENHYNPSNPN